MTQIIEITSIFIGNILIVLATAFLYFFNTKKNNHFKRILYRCNVSYGKIRGKNTFTRTGRDAFS